MKRKMTKAEYTQKLEVQAYRMTTAQLWQKIAVLDEVYKAQMLCLGNISPKLRCAIQAFGNELQFRITGIYPTN